MRRLYVFRNGEFVECNKPEVKQTHQVITDEMAGTLHPCDGKVYTSKSNFNKTTRAHGCTAIGNEQVKPLALKENPRDRQKLRDTIGRIYADMAVASGRNERACESMSAYMQKLQRG